MEGGCEAGTEVAGGCLGIETVTFWRLRVRFRF